MEGITGSIPVAPTRIHPDSQRKPELCFGRLKAAEASLTPITVSLFKLGLL
jgi:hypothetical protein